MPLFPEKIGTFVDLFCGGCNVGINVPAKKTIFNDNLSFLVDLYKQFNSLSINEILNHIENRINQFNLSLTNKAGYLALRKLYNQEKILWIYLFLQHILLIIKYALTILTNLIILLERCEVVLMNT